MHTILEKAAKVKRQYLLSKLPEIVGLSLLMIMTAVWLYPSVNRLSTDLITEQTEDLVRMTWSMVSILDQEIEAGSLTAEEAITLATNILNKSQKNAARNVHLWIMSEKGELIFHPGMNSFKAEPIEWHDINKEDAIQRIQTLIRNSEEAYLDADWTCNSVQTEERVHQASFVKGYEKWGWLIGSDIWNKEVSDRVTSLGKQITQGLLVGILAFFFLGLLFFHSWNRAYSTISNQFREMNKLSQVIENCSLSVMTTDVEGTITYLNPYYEKSSGYKQEKLLGKNVLDRFLNIEANHVSESVKKAVQGKKIWKRELINQRRDGSNCCESVQVGPILDEKGKVSEFYIIKKDITENKKLEKEFIQAKEAAENSNRLKSSFIKTLSHEIRTPLNAISGFTSLIEDEGISDQEKKDFFKVIHENVELLENQFERILTVSNLEADKNKSNFGNWNLDALFREAIHNSEQSGRFKLNPDVKLQYAPDNTLGVSTVYADRVNFVKVLTELLCNAIKYTENGTIKVGFRTHSEKLEIFVSDTGLGISDLEKPHIFKAFHMGEDHFFTLNKGCGIGLYFVEKLVEAMKGEITFESEIGKGTTFVIRGIATPVMT